MKTLPIMYTGRNDVQSIMLREYLRKEREKISKILLITPPEQKQKPLELISEKENAKILETMKKISKEIFGK